MLQAYELLEQRFKQIDAIEGAIAVLHWDSAVMMPEGGSGVRAEQLAALVTMAHELLIAPEVKIQLDEAFAAEGSLSDWQKANLQEMCRIWVHGAAVESSLLAAFTRATSECEMVWRKARAENDFAGFAPHLEKVVGYVREIAAAKANHLGVSQYDALLDNYDPGRKSAEIDDVFDNLAKFLPGFIQQVIDHQAQLPVKPLEGFFPQEKQKNLGIHAIRTLGFDFNQGRLDVSHHPFCGGVPSDIRITTRYNEQDFLPSLMGVLHETGHALYEQQLPEAWRSQPVGKARGMSIHESQSLLMEMQACRSKEFIRYIQPHIIEAFGVSGDAWETDNIYRNITRVERSLIRVDADEVTYPAHVMLRYSLEKSMISGDLPVKELPFAWREGMERLIGITPPDDKDGCMQDIHWPGGSFGYFPTYTLGAIIAAQLFAAAKKQIPALLQEIAEGKFTTLTNWLREHVHGWGSRYTSDALLTHATGIALDVESYKQHLRQRYLEN